MLRLSAIAILLAGPAAAASGSYDFTSLFNTDFVVLIGFLLFLAVLFYFNVPALLMGLLDKRAAQIQADLDEARALREEAQSLLASFERKQREVADQADRIVAAAEADAKAAADAARLDLDAAIARRLQAAEDQIASAEEKAERAIQTRAADVAVAAAADILGSQTSATEANRLIDAAIEEVGARLN